MTSQFSIRPLEKTDADWIYEACQDSELQRWTEIPKPYERHHAIDFASTMSGDVEVWVIQGEKPVGVIGVHSINPISRIAEIGYWTAPWGRKQGAMRSGLLQFIEKMKLNPDVATIHATIADGNIASRKTAESAGFQLLGAAERSCNCGGEQVAAVLYGARIKASLI